VWEICSLLYKMYKMCDLKFSNYFTVKILQYNSETLVCMLWVLRIYVHPSVLHFIFPSVLVRRQLIQHNGRLHCVHFFAVTPVATFGFSLLSVRSAKVWFFKDVWCSLPSCIMKVTIQFLHYVYFILDIHVPVLKMLVLMCCYVSSYTSSKRKKLIAVSLYPSKTQRLIYEFIKHKPYYNMFQLLSKPSSGNTYFTASNYWIAFMYCK
jgi:hypothetical protein